MIRLGLAIDALAPQLTGIGRYTWNLCAGLARHRDITSIRYFRNGRWFRDPSWFLTSERPRRYRLPRALRSMVTRHGFRDRLFHSPNYLLPSGAGRSIVTVHDLSVFRFPEFHPAARIRAFEEGFFRSIEAASHIITDTQWIRTELHEFAQIPLNRITAVPLGVGRAFFRATLPVDAALLARHGLEAGNYLLCVATLEPRKGLEQAIVAFEQFADRYPTDLKLAIVGASGWHNGPLRTRIEQAQRRGRVQLLGFVEEADLPAIYGNARLFMFPSAYEGFGLPPIEAMACEVPTIVSDRSCLPEVTKGASMLVDPDDISALSEGIMRGLTDDSWRASAIEKGRQVARSYTWERCVEETVDVYRRVGM